MSSFVHLSFVFCGLIVASLWLPFRANAEQPLDYTLSLSFSTDERQLIGTARINLPPGRRLSLYFPELNITGSLLRDESGREQELTDLHDGLVLPAESGARTLFLSYQLRDGVPSQSQITPDGIGLTSNWYPVPDQPALFTLTAALPEGFTAIAEADTFPLQTTGSSVTARFSQPTTNIHFVAGPYITAAKKVRDGLSVYTMFFPEDAGLAEEYLMKATASIHQLEEQLGTFPYNHYVIVANRQPTGFGMPTFTLIGQQVLRLPFIKDTSLVHEIVHSWFGNSVEVDTREGNWCEGLTTFLADHSQREKTGEGREARRETIVKYLNYVGKEAELPLGLFHSASHSQPLAEVKRAVGYNRGAMFFHELREKIGTKPFNESLRSFYQTYQHRSASWSDLEASFTQATGEKLHQFFLERLTRKDIPDLSIEKPEIRYHDHQPALRFTLHQETETPFTLLVPVAIETLSGTVHAHVESNAKSTPVTIELQDRPLSFSVDPDYTMLRVLREPEYPPVWSRLLGAKEKLIILETEDSRSLYAPLIDLFHDATAKIVLAEAVTNKQLAENNLLFLGTKGSACRSLFGSLTYPAGLIVDVRKNPLNTEKAAVVISSSDPAESAAASHLLSHYGKYSYLAFAKGHNVQKSIAVADAGIQVRFESLPEGLATQNVADFSALLQSIAGHQLVYIGELHTSLSDHLLQLRIIESLYRLDPKLAIAMEMFPSSAQPVLDRYTLSDKNLTERQFLKESAYYDVWRYDFRLFRDIFNFARAHQLPVLGLNLDRHIVSEIYRSGTTDSLTPEQKAVLPPDRDLDLPGYVERLNTIHSFHQQGGAGSGKQSGFIQAQGIWDETMAANLASYLDKHPKTRIVVLAGREHTRKDSGIPPRLARRVAAVNQATLINITDGGVPENVAALADYLFFGNADQLPEQPKIGIILREEQGKEKAAGVYIDELSPHGYAKEAGLLPGDRLVSVNGVSIDTLSDVHIALLDTVAEEKIAVEVSRREQNSQQKLQLQARLSSMPPLSPTP